jgi:transaldolase
MQGGDPGRIASVASFFVSRIDVAVDGLIEERLGETRPGIARWWCGKHCEQNQ